MFRLPYKFTFYYDNDTDVLFTGQVSMNNSQGDVILIVMWEQDGELTGVTYPEEVAIRNITSEAWTIVDVISE